MGKFMRMTRTNSNCIDAKLVERNIVAKRSSGKKFEVRTYAKVWAGEKLACVSEVNIVHLRTPNPGV